MAINNTNQSQTAGDNSNQTQIENQTQNNYYYGAAPSEMVTIATTVYNQMYALTATNYAQIAKSTVDERINAFGCELFPRLEKIEGALESFKDPKFEFMLRDAQITAAKTDKAEDLQLLTELLVSHIESGKDRMINAGISRAIKIVDEIDNSALCALTVAYAVLRISPTSGIVSEGMSVLDNLFSKLLYLELPTNTRWIDHLNILGALNIMFGNFHSVNRQYTERFNGYCCAGIKENSVEYNQARELLSQVKVEDVTLVSNELLPGYFRLSIVSLDDIPADLKPIVELYSKDKEILKTVSDSFSKLILSYPHVAKVIQWFDSIDRAFNISDVGKALVQTNAKRLDPEFPDLLH